MNDNQNQSAQLLLFPVQIASEEEMASCDDVSVLYWQVRFSFIELADTIRLYNRKPDSSAIERLRVFNAFAREYGFPILECW